mmetsp:Transcript_12926/g.29349  ORF Transcript_12926/g.29349 Transcript_12926/m.29349 type:complete len:407 (-) Transcript_12926:3-1223(-)
MCHGPVIERVLLCNDEYGKEHDAQDHKTDGIVDEEAPHVAPLFRSASVLVLDGALQGTAAFVRRTAQAAPGSPDQDHLKNPAPEDDGESPSEAWPEILTAMLIRVPRHCDARKVEEKTEDRPEDAVREELHSFEPQDVIDELILVSFVNDQEEDKEGQGARSAHGEAGEQEEASVDWVTYSSPDRLVIGLGVIPQERADTIRLGFVVIGRKLVSVQSHGHLPHDLFTYVRPRHVNQAVFAAGDKPWHVGVLEIGLNLCGQLVDQPLGVLLHLVLQPGCQQRLELCPHLVETLRGLRVGRRGRDSQRGGDGFHPRRGTGDHAWRHNLEMVLCGPRCILRCGCRSACGGAGTRRSLLDALQRLHPAREPNPFQGIGGSLWLKRCPSELAGLPSQGAMEAGRASLALNA